ncbi:helix-turn-helix transcriptional regulator [Thauera sp. Sel9]|uniref:helix-turn-helix transcriptional regulator n=1 Tax=Thauera sp. Sel9 TaxID=2974299 RepID=UPI0021E11BA7|nr:AlpA family phage regulatory protein [Thauera sp. Sel9]MCV2218902.1 AlpA family phage regulatory protein [Thauera sp. Sel9]
MQTPATLKPSVSHFDNLPASGLVDDKTVAGVLGCSRNTIWRKAKAGDLPSPVKVGPKTTRWQVGAIREYLASLTAQQSAA